jgi:capsule polysaccharide export protein KpsE/RkpR
MPIAETSSMSMAMSLMDGFGLGAMRAPRAIQLKYSAILQSRTITENTIREFDLISYFNITEADSLRAMDISVRTFHNSLFNLVLNEEVSFITVNITTSDRYFSRIIAEYYLQVLINYARDNPNNLGRQQRELLESRINDILAQVRTLTETISIFKQEHNIIEIQSQAIAAIEGYNAIINELVALELELEFVERFLPNQPRLRDLTQRRQIMLDTVRRFETGNPETPFLLPLNEVTDQLIILQGKMFELDILERILQTIYPQLELARIEEINDMDRLEIIDLPSLPGLRSFPRRALICIITFFIALFFSCTLVIFKSVLSDEDKEKARTIWKTLWRG